MPAHVLLLFGRDTNNLAACHPDFIFGTTDALLKAVHCWRASNFSGSSSAARQQFLNTR
jgi:hypothetical protein